MLQSFQLIISNFTEERIRLGDTWKYFLPQRSPKWEWIAYFGIIFSSYLAHPLFFDIRGVLMSKTDRRIKKVSKISILINYSPRNRLINSENHPKRLIRIFTQLISFRFSGLNSSYRSSSSAFWGFLGISLTSPTETSGLQAYI